MGNSCSDIRTPGDIIDANTCLDFYQLDNLMQDPGFKTVSCVNETYIGAFLKRLMHKFVDQNGLDFEFQ